MNALFRRCNTIAIKVNKKRSEAENGKIMQGDTFHEGISTGQL